MMRPHTPSKPQSRLHATVDVAGGPEALLVRVSGLVDEKFAGFGDIGATKAIVIDVSGMSRMSSFGVRQWIKALETLPKSADLYLLGCPTFFVDQLNMVLGFGGASKVLTVSAPFTCAACGVESSELVDVGAERAAILQGNLAPRSCKRCGQTLELDETPESYFAFLRQYSGGGVHPAAAKLLSSLGLYSASGLDEGAEKPAKVIKLVHGSVTYFRIIGTIGALFRARPFLIGAEGEIVIDLAEVDRFDPSGHKEWKRMLKSLAAQVPSVTLVDVDQSYLSEAGDTLVLARNVIVASLNVSRRCAECGRTSHDTTNLARVTWPISFGAGTCGLCGGTTHSVMELPTLAPLQKASTVPPDASAKVIAQRGELMSRAMTDANVAQAGEAAAAAVSADETILGKYKIVQRLSVGGMAEVFLANQVGIGGFEKPVALKRIQRKLLESRQAAISMFLNEAKIAGRLQHPNIAQVLDVGEVGGSLYLAMEYVHGKDLRAITKRLKQNGTTLLPLGEALYIVREVAQALDFAYWSNDMTGKQLSVVHRDVSPHNIILGYDGAVKLIDFGVAMSSVTEHAESLVVGKWHYMAPEATSSGHVDHRSDLFSLGVVLYLLVSGDVPFTDREPKEIVKKIRNGQFKRLEDVAVVPDALANLVHRMLSPKPEGRPQRGQEVVKVLDDIARGSGIESSSIKIADLLRDLFPDEASSPFEDAALEIQVGEHGSHSKSPHTPPSYSLSRFDGQVDVSVTLHRRSSKSISIAPSSKSMSSVTPAPALPEKPAGSRTLLKILLVLLFASMLAAAAYYLLPMS